MNPVEDVRIAIHNLTGALMDLAEDAQTFGEEELANEWIREVEKLQEKIAEHHDV